MEKYAHVLCHYLSFYFSLNIILLQLIFGFQIFMFILILPEVKMIGKYSIVNPGIN